MEIEQFHQVLLESAATLRDLGPGWTAIRDRLGHFFRETVPARSIQQRTKGRLQYLAADHGFSGSLFPLEATVVMDAWLDQL
jgi:hypothetical protein